MRPFIRTLILTASLACGPGYITPGYIDQGVEEHVVAVSLAYSTRASWQRSPWYRIGDETHELPVFVLTDTAGNGCLVPGDIWALNPRWVACPDGWRRPRAG
jgi:hypothetical protein